MRSLSGFVAGLALAAAGTASAFCGFFVTGSNAKLSNNASQVVLLRKGNHTTMTMSNNYQGPPENFAMVVPVPVVLHKQDVKTLAPDVFDHIDSLSAPRLVEYWEQDPCFVPRPRRMYKKGGAIPEEEGEAPGSGGLGVKIEAQFVVGEYEIVILSASDSAGLETWLRLNKYNIPAGAAEALAPYVREQMKFFVAKVDIKKVKRDEHGMVVLSPLRFSYDANELRLPVRLGLLNADGKQDLIVYVLHPSSRFEVANYPNVFIPTNLDVADSVRHEFPSFYAQLFDATLERNQGRAVVTEYAWQTTSCDPCPVPPLQPSDLATLGEGPETPTAGSAQKGGEYYGDASPWVLTRLHTRYDKKALSEDLVFREAKAVVGGRGSGGEEAMDHGVQPAPENNFQARYIIRHYWSGKVKCDHPVWGRWGGPPSGVSEEGGAGPVRPAKGLALAPRGKVKLPSVIHTAVPSLGIAGRKPPKREGEK